MRDEAVLHKTRLALSNGNFQILGRVDRGVNYRDNIKQSQRVHDFFPDFVPNYVYCAANKQAELPSVAKYDRVNPTPETYQWSLANSWLNTQCIPLMGCGEVDYDIVVEELDKTTSPGYPWTTKFSTKKLVLALLNFKLWVLMIKALMEVISPEPKYVPLWTSSVKAEMRPVEKARLNKLRTFCASPVEFTIISNMLCLDFNNTFYRLGMDGSSWFAVGMTKYNRGWDRLGRRLKRHPNGFALDVSSFDACLFAQSLYEICELRIRCSNYNIKQATQLRNVYHHIVNSVIVLSNGDVVRKSTGNPSGSGNTVVDNTLHLRKLMNYAWIVLAPDGYATLEMFEKHVEAALYGDDNTFSVSDEVVGWFNARSISKVLLGLGVVITSEDDVWEPRPLTDLKFLSNGFAEIDGVWLPVPDTNKVMSSLLEKAECHDPRWDFLRAAALLQDSYWNVELRLRLKAYIQYLFRFHRNQMQDGLVYKTVNFSEIKNTYKTDEQIRSLYLCEEALLEAEECQTPPLKVDHCQTNMSKIAELKNRILQGPRLAFSGAKNVERKIEKQIKSKERKLEKKIEEKMPSKTKGKKFSKAERKAFQENKSKVVNDQSVDKKRRGYVTNQHIGGSGNGMTISRRSLIGAITGKSTFTTLHDDMVTPTNTTLFPWLSQIAVLFETFELLSFSMHYRTNSGPETTHQAQGQVSMAFIYDADDLAMTNLTTLLNYSRAVSGVTYKDLVLRMDPTCTLFKKLFVSHSGSTDLTAPAKFQLAVDGQPGTNEIIGYLWCEYKVRLSIPRENPISPMSAKYHYVTGFATWNQLKVGNYIANGVKTSGWPLARFGGDMPSGEIELFMDIGVYDVDVIIFSGNATHGGVLGYGFNGQLTAITGDSLHATNVRKVQQAGVGTMWHFTTRCQRVGDGSSSDAYAAFGWIALVFSNTDDSGGLEIKYQIRAVGVDTTNTTSPLIGSSHVSIKDKMAELEEKVAALSGEKKEVKKTVFEQKFADAKLLAITQEEQDLGIPTNASSSSSSSCANFDGYGRTFNTPTGS